MLILIVAIGLALLVAGQVLGRWQAEKSAVLHSDCATAHHMQGGFYYIVPEKEYCRLVMLQYGEEGRRAIKCHRCNGEIRETGTADEQGRPLHIRCYHLRCPRGGGSIPGG